jgi:hypothetical protein
MGELYGHDGVAVVTRYDLLYDALKGSVGRGAAWPDSICTDHLTDRFNALEFVTTKQEKYAGLRSRVVRNQLQTGEHLPGTLQLDLPGEGDPHYRFIAEKHGNVWWVDAKVKRPDLTIRFRSTSRL